MKLSNLVPRFIKYKLIMAVREHDNKLEKEKVARIPVYDLSEKHIKNARLLTNREELLKKMKPDAIVAELGVDEGGFSEKILSITNPSKFHLIDLWGSERYNDNKRLSVTTKFKDEIEVGKIEINHGYSTDVVKEFPDNYFDWIYIDTAHSYKVTIEELNAYLPKMKEDGIIAGHDFTQGNWIDRLKYGVIEAVYEFCNKNDWEIIYITSEAMNYPSFAIRKIN